LIIDMCNCFSKNFRIVTQEDYQPRCSCIYRIHVEELFPQVVQPSHKERDGIGTELCYLQSTCMKNTKDGNYLKMI
jgi:hypothetical protein